MAGLDLADRVTVDVHTSWPWNCTESMLVKGMALAEKYDVQFATHLFEAPDEKRLANELCANEGGAIQYLRNIGLVNERSVFFHCTQLNEEEIDIMAETGSAITHCPTNNARKGDCAYVPYMRDAGVRLGLATDNPFCVACIPSPCCDSDIQAEMRGIAERRCPGFFTTAKTDKIVFFHFTLDRCDARPLV